MPRVAPIVLLPALVALAGCGGGEPAPEPVPAGGGATTLLAPQPARPASTPAPRPLERPALRVPSVPRVAGRWMVAQPQRRVRLRSAPGGRPVGAIGPRTEFGGRRVVSVLRRRGDWLKVIVPERPNARPAWIPAARTRVAGTDVALVIDLSDRLLTVRSDGRVIARVAVGVGAADHPTPTGRFAVTDKLRMDGPGTTYGCFALALSAHQPDLPDAWNGLDRIAIHGTQSPETIGVAASLGCLHAGERDLHRLMRIVPVGAPVFIRT